MLFVTWINHAYGISVDCPNMLNFAYGLGLQSSRPVIWSSLQTDCCTTSGVFCVSERVTQIKWNDMDANGILNGTAIPSEVNIMELWNIRLTGSIPSVLPAGLTVLELGQNSLTGSIPDTLPNGLQFLHLHGNQLGGDLPIFPSSLNDLLLNYPGYNPNHFTGSLQLIKPIRIAICNNWISDVVFQDTSALGECNLDNNPLLGNSNIANLTMCTKNGIYSASEIKIDFTDITNFARALGLQSTQPSIWNQLQIDYCTASGVTCIKQKVTEIDWNRKGLNGSINGSAIPSGLTFLRLWRNKLTGGIPTLPNGLLHLDLSGNNLNNTIPSILPSGLDVLDVYTNKLTGILPLLPTGLTYLDVSDNLMSGDLPPLPISISTIWVGWSGHPGNHFTGTLNLNQPREVYINDNWITDVVIQNSDILTTCHLDNNPLLGNINIDNLTMCTKNGFYNASAIKIDCPNMINLAIGLGIQNAQPSIWNQLQIDCCTVNGVTCIGQKVTKIDWNTRGLKGFINGTALPNALQILRLNSNNLTGHIPIELPSTLRELTIYQNLLTGGIPNLPSALKYLNIHSNKLSGQVPLLPLGIQNVYLGYVGGVGNQFTGTLNLSRPFELYINDNWITDVVVQNTSALVGCDLSNNPLLENLNIANLTMCTKNGIYNASMLPKTDVIVYMETSEYVSSTIVAVTNQTMETSFATKTLKPLEIKYTIYSKIAMVTDTNTETFLSEIVTTVQFAEIFVPFLINYTMVIQVAISLMILIYVLVKTPFVREIKRMAVRTKSSNGKTSSANF